MVWPNHSLIGHLERLSLDDDEEDGEMNAIKAFVSDILSKTQESGEAEEKRRRADMDQLSALVQQQSVQQMQAMQYLMENMTRVVDNLGRMIASSIPQNTEVETSASIRSEARESSLSGKVRYRLRNTIKYHSPSQSPSQSPTRESD